MGRVWLCSDVDGDWVCEYRKQRYMLVETEYVCVQMWMKPDYLSTDVGVENVSKDVARDCVSKYRCRWTLSLWV